MMMVMVRMMLMVVRMVGIDSTGPIVMPSMGWDGFGWSSSLRPGPTATPDDHSALLGRVGGILDSSSNSLTASLLFFALPRG